MILLPTRRLLLLLLAWTALGLAASVWMRLLPVWRLAGWTLLAVVILESLALLLLKPFAAQRECSPSLAIGAWKPVKLRLTSTSALPWRCTIMDHHPTDFRARGQGQTHWIPASGFLELGYHVRPMTRGPRAFGPVQVRAEGPLGMMARDLRLPCATELKVFPDFATLARYALLATDNRLSTLGILKRPRRGEGMDFHQLREYRTGDSLRRIDWKATARARKLISREYQDERDQQIFFLLDCGRRMRALDEVEGKVLGHFDQALNALFLLSYVALKQGDAVGVATCALDQDRLLAPRKGLAALDHLFQRLFDLEPSLHATDHLAAARELHQRVKRRSLVVLLTNLRDEEDETLAPALNLLRSRHLVLVANLRESVADQVLAKAPEGFDEALLQASTVLWRQARERSLLALRHHGAQVLDVSPEHLPVALVNRYLELKTSGVF
jgi:uncharacterized protein (DUF58 family)